VVHVREPGGTRLGEKIRRILLDPKGGRRSARAEALLYVAARAELVDERIAPALRRGAIVVSERFSSATIVYQGLAGGVGAVGVEAIDAFARDGVEPDLTIVLDLPPETGLARVVRARARDRMERLPLAYHRRVRRGFLAWARARGRKAVVVDADRDADLVARDVRAEVARALR